MWTSVVGRLFYTIYASDIGRLWIGSTEKGIIFIRYIHGIPSPAALQALEKQYKVQENRHFFTELISQLDFYFNGQPVHFKTKLDLTGTPFQKKVWRAVQQIPRGQTKTYGQIASELGSPGASRAIGAANGANPVPILVPCHRVLASGGKLGGYAGGLKVKDALLRLEGVII